MNAQAHLLSLGWAGPGHSLDSRPDGLSTYKQKGHRGLAYDPARDPAKVGNTGTGLVKPLSISQRKARFGIGKKAHEPASGTNWWLKGFETALGNIGKSESERSSGVSTPTGNAATRFSNGGGKHGGLYGFFIRGQLMEGSIKDEDDQSRGKKRKSDALEDEDESPGGVSSSNSTEHKTKAGQEASKEFETVAAFLGESQKGEKRRKRKEKNGEVEQFDQIGQFFETTDGVERKRRKQKPDSTLPVDSAAQDSLTNSDAATRVETKEERRERRRKRREKKESKAKKLESMSNETNGIQKPGHDDERDVSDSVAKAAKKLERKRRKAAEEEATSKSKT